MAAERAGASSSDAGTNEVSVNDVDLDDDDDEDTSADEIAALKAQLAAANAAKEEAEARTSGAELAAREATLKASEAQARLKEVSAQIIQPSRDDMVRLGINSGLMGGGSPQPAQQSSISTSAGGPVTTCSGDALGECRCLVTDKKNYGAPPYNIAWTIPDNLRQQVGCAQYLISFVGGQARVPAVVAEWFAGSAEGKHRYDIQY